MGFERSVLDAVREKTYERAALVTLVSLEGSGYQRPGARMVVFDDGTSVGSVTGGCLEKTVIERALVGLDRERFSFTVDTTSDADTVFGYGLGCSGTLLLEVEPFRRNELPPALVVAMRVNASRAPKIFGAELIEAVPHMIVAGAGNDVAPIVSIARASGYEVSQVRRIESRPQICDARTVAVLVTHNLLSDLESARHLVQTDIAYVGVIGSRKRFSWLTEELKKDGLPVDRLKGPAGLAIGAQTPSEIALSVVAEASAALSVRVTPVILAAGAASRFGSPKQLAEVEGRALVRRAIDLFGSPQSRCGTPVVVTGAHAREVADTIADGNAIIVRNDEWPSGIASSIRTGVMRAKETGREAVLLMLCDQAAITARDIESLVAAWYRSPQSIVAAEYDGVTGVPAIFPRGHFDELLALHGDEGARRLLRDANDVMRVPMPNAAIDIDTPQDLVASDPKKLKSASMTSIQP